MKKQHTKMDFLVLAVVLALIVGVFFKARMVRSQPEPVSFTYQMALINPAEGIADHMMPGDTVICDAGKQPVGTIVQVQTMDGDMVLTIQAEGFAIEGGYRTNVYDILPGFEYDFYTETASWYGIVTDTQ